MNAKLALGLGLVGVGIFTGGWWLAKSGHEPVAAGDRGKDTVVPFNSKTEHRSPQVSGKLSLASLTALARKPDKGSANELWAKIDSLGATPQETRALRIQLIEGLVVSGQFDEAKKLIDLHAGPGEKRDALVFSLFTKCPLPFAETLQLLDKTFADNPHDRRVALDGLSRSMANAGGIDRFEAFLKSGVKLDKDAAAILSSGLAPAANVSEFGSSYYADPDAPPPLRPSELGAFFQRNEALLKLMEAANPETFKFVLNNYLQGAAGLSPDLALATLDKFRDKLDPDKLAALERSFAKMYGERSGAEAMTDSVGSGSPGRTASAFLGWFRNDSSAAEAWLKENFDSLPAPQKDALASEMVKKRLETQSLEEARKMVAAISDPEARRIADGWAWAKERDMLRSEVNQNPSATVDAIVSGGSRYQEYWLEEAMGNWIAKDFDKAHGWYEKNWESLPAAKAQYVAAAFATVALNQGNLDTAREWAGLIQDAKTKERVNAAIAKGVKK